MGDFNFERDCSVSFGSITKHIEFKINSAEITATELENMGYTISSDKQTASKDVTCDTATYTFEKLPEDLEDIKKIPLDNKFGPMAACICTIALYTPEKKVSIQTVDYKTWEINEAFDYLNGKCEIANVHKQNTVDILNNAFGYNTNTVSGGCYEYFDGASNTNGYIPNKPYSFTIYEGPYFIPAKAATIAHPNGEPEKHMIFVEPEGDESARYIDVYHSGDGNWYSWDISFKHLLASMKQVSTGW